MQRRQLHSRPVSEHSNGVDAHLKDDSSAEVAANPSPAAGGEAKVRLSSGREVYDDGTKTFFW